MRGCGGAWGWTRAIVIIVVFRSLSSSDGNPRNRFPIPHFACKIHLFRDQNRPQFGSIDALSFMFLRNLNWILGLISTGMEDPAAKQLAFAGKQPLYSGLNPPNWMDFPQF